MRINLGIRRRLAPLVGNDRKKMELLNGLLFCMPGTPVLYYGDEIGMGDNVWLGDRNGVRTPMQWSADRNAGFSRANPQRLILPINIDPEYHFEALNVEAQQSNPNSLLWWTKRLVAMRRRYRAFSRGTVDFLHPSNPRVLAFVRRYSEGEGEPTETILVVANLSRHVQFVELDLSAMKGMVPVEVMGRTRFPAIGELPYLLTLGGHDFYWFSLTPPRETPEERRSLMGPVGLHCSSVDALLFGEERSLLEDALPSFLHARGLVGPNLTGARILETARVGDGTPPLAYVFVRVEYVEGEAETFAFPLQVVAEMPAGATVVASVQARGAPAPVLLVEGTTPSAAAVLIDAITRRRAFTLADGDIRGDLVNGRTIEPEGVGGAGILASDGAGAALAWGKNVLKLLYRMEEGVAPELEIARLFQHPEVGRLLTPRVDGYLARCTPRAEPVTLALLEEYVVHESTALEQARSELGRVYERVLAHAPDARQPTLPSQSLVELSQLAPPEEHFEAVGGYLDWAALLGRRTAELHLAFSSSTDPAFEPKPYSPMDQRSKYQSGRNLVGRVLASLRRSLTDLPASARPSALQLLQAEDALHARFEPIRTGRIEANQIRCHGDLHLGRLLFTGKDFVVIGFGAGRDRRLSERRRRRGALRDVACMVRSFHYAAATSLSALRPEDHARAEAWGWVWQGWASATFVRAYLGTAKDAAFVPRGPMLGALLDAATLEKAFTELRRELMTRPERAWIPIAGALRLLGIEPNLHHG
jgi:maltose alpha-D-glucosyltransferase/alpha-amylase